MIYFKSAANIMQPLEAVLVIGVTKKFEITLLSILLLLF
jgi:hypothetical protein